jgi:hypothetical protein
VEPDGPKAAAQVDTAPPQDDAPAANEDALALLSDEDREELSLMAADAGLSRQAMVAFLCQRALAERRDRLTSRQQAGGTPAVDVAGPRGVASPASRADLDGTSSGRAPRGSSGC